MTEAFTHPLADVQSAAIGSGTRIWQFSIVLPGAKIVQVCNICSAYPVNNDINLLRSARGSQNFLKNTFSNEAPSGNWLGFRKCSDERYQRRRRHIARSFACEVQT